MTELFETFKSEIFTKQYIFLIFLVTIFYIALAAYSVNYRFVLSTINGNYPFLYKSAILFYLVEGLKTALSDSDLVLLMITSVLVGVNVALIIRSLHIVRKSGKVKFVVGGSTLLGFVSTGCVSCGFSLISVLGLGAALKFLPGVLALHIMSTTLLLLSAIYMVKKVNDSLNCKIKH